MFRVRLVLNTVGAHFDRASTNLVQAVWLRRWTDDLGFFVIFVQKVNPYPKPIGSQLEVSMYCCTGRILST